jgi:L-lysine 6-transaminase
MSIAPVLAERSSTRNRTPKNETQKAIAPAKVLHTIEEHVLLDGFKIVVDLDKSRGSYLFNRVDNRRLIDLY